MMEVQGLGSVGGPSPAVPPQAVHAAHLQENQPASGVADQVEISEMANILDELSQLPEIRQEKVAEVRQAIEMGTYETQDKLEITVERLLRDLRG